jgi:hypothetical protein
MHQRRFALPVRWLHTLTWTTNNAVADEIIYVAFASTAATAVDLKSFTATGAQGSVLVEWETTSELNLGFHLYRATAEEAPYERITAAPIPGLGSSPEGARYRFLDSGLSDGQTYYYKLEDIETTGKTKQHGPVSATPGEGPARAFPDTSSPVGITYGEPTSGSFRVLRSDLRGMELELVTPGFYAEPRSDGSMRLHVPGFVEELEPGSPAVPVKRAWLDALAGRGVRVASVRAEDVQRFSGLRIEATGSPELIATRDGVARAGRRPRGEGQAFRRPGLFPEQAARVLDVGFQEDVKKAWV